MPDNKEKNLIEEIHDDLYPMTFLDDVYPTKSLEAISLLGILMLEYLIRSVHGSCTN